MKQLNNTHLFAIYWPPLTAFSGLGTIILNDPLLMHRLLTVLRMEQGDEWLLFFEGRFARVQLITVEKKHLNLKIIAVNQQSMLTPAISVGLPLLKKEALEEAVYAATELGVQEINLIITEKSRKQLHGFELERLNRIMVAACEQAKYFYLPLLKEPVTLPDFIANQPKLFFFDPAGNSFQATLQKNLTASYYTTLIGPEGDLTPQEKEAIQDKIIPIKLTPTILRAPQAITVGVGYLRTFFNS